MRKLIVLLIAIISIFSIYIVKYQQLVNEGSELADEHCITINPLIIKRKQAYIKSMQAIQKNPDLYLAENNNYLKVAKDYLKAEKEWLERQNSFLNRWDNRLIMDKRVQEAGMWQYKAYEADYKGTDTIVRAFESKDAEEQNRLGNATMQFTKDAEKAQAEYAKMWENKPTGFDIRNYFIRIPTSKCSVENYAIPDVQKEIGI